MVRRRPFVWIALAALLFVYAPASAQPMGSIRGVVIDKDFDVPLSGATVLIVETGQKVTTTDQGNYSFGEVPAGNYTLVFSKDGYTRQVKSEVVVSPGQLTDLNIDMLGDFTDMEEFVVEDVRFDGTSEEALQQIRIESPALLDSIGADMMSKAGASDAAGALRLVAGATVQDGKFAVVRGLPDRYVNSQLNGVRLPTSDEDKRAVQLDQFPSAVIESVRVTKTFTPDQQGDASGGAVNVVLKGIPEENVLKFSSQVSYNTQVRNRDDFLTYKGGGVNFWGNDRGKRDIQFRNIGDDWTGAVGVSRDQAPVDYKFSLAAGGKEEFANGITVGGFASFFYERDSSFYDNGIDDARWVENPGDPMTPKFEQGTPGQGEFVTSLFDVTKGVEEVRWGGLGTLGVESENHSLNLIYLYTRIAEDEAVLAEDTRGKRFYFPGYDPDGDPFTDPLLTDNDRGAAPYLRTETLKYTERTTESLQLNGEHKLPDLDLGVEDVIKFRQPVLDWTLARSEAHLYEPDKRQFGSTWAPETLDPGFPPFVPPSITPRGHGPFKPAEVFTLGNLQRTWKDIREDSKQYFMNLKFPFEQWSGDEGYVKVGFFHDEVTRKYDQESFSNFNDNTGGPNTPFEELWSDVFPDETHPVTDGPPFVDVDYTGEQDLKAFYWMTDLPVTSRFKLIGGMRFENTELSIINTPEADATWFPPGALTVTALNPGDADVAFEQRDVLPSIGFVYDPTEKITFRGAYSETVARQTFKELSPIQQQEFLGGDVFIGNPNLQMSALKNYDLRLDYRPYEGGLVSVSYFKKDVTDPIEYVQRVATFTYTTPLNFPEGEIEGWEFEVRQDLGHFWAELQGLSVGANATLIDSQVTLPATEAAMFSAANVLAPQTTRDMTNAPEHLYNLYLTYESEETGTQVGLFYTVRGDTLVAGAGVSDGNFVPSVYEKEFDTLNLSITQKIGEHVKVKFQAKNLTDPDIQEVYRSRFIGDDVLKTSFTKGIDFSLSISAEFTF